MFARLTVPLQPLVHFQYCELCPVTSCPTLLGVQPGPLPYAHPSLKEKRTYNYKDNTLLIKSYFTDLINMNEIFEIVINTIQNC